MTSENSTDKNLPANEEGQKPSRKLITLFSHEDESWQPHPDVKGFLDYINPVGDMHLSIQNTEILQKPLSFYEKEAMLISVHNLYPPEVPEDEYYIGFVQIGDDIIMLNGDSANVYEINDLGKLNLNQDKVFDYLKFFAANMISEETLEPFLLVEGPESEFLESLSRYESDRILRGYTGPRVISSTNGGPYMIECRLIHAGELFDAKFKVMANGEVIMTNDKRVGSI